MKVLDWNNYDKCQLFECNYIGKPGFPIIAFFDSYSVFWDFYFLYKGKFYKMMTNCNDSVKRDFIVTQEFIGDFRPMLDAFDKAENLVGIDYPSVIKLLTE